MTAYFETDSGGGYASHLQLLSEKRKPEMSRTLEVDLNSASRKVLPLLQITYTAHVRCQQILKCMQGGRLVCLDAKSRRYLFKFLNSATVFDDHHSADLTLDGAVRYDACIGFLTKKS